MAMIPMSQWITFMKHIHATGANAQRRHADLRVLHASLTCVPQCTWSRCCGWSSRLSFDSMLVARIPLRPGGRWP